MFDLVDHLEELIHRHTGGLEINHAQIAAMIDIHRHTGGLERWGSSTHHRWIIHRHTGGLEKHCAAR